MLSGSSPISSRKGCLVGQGEEPRLALRGVREGASDVTEEAARGEDSLATGPGPLALREGAGGEASGRCVRWYIPVRCEGIAISRWVAPT
jgi:hypothetical protein